MGVFSKETFRRLGALVVIAGIVTMSVSLGIGKRWKRIYSDVGIYGGALLAIFGFFLIGLIQVIRIKKQTKRKRKKKKEKTSEASQTITCQQCKTEVPIENQFCSVCGKIVPVEVVRCEWLSAYWTACNVCRSPTSFSTENHFFAKPTETTPLVQV